MQPYWLIQKFYTAINLRKIIENYGTNTKHRKHLKLFISIKSLFDIEQSNPTYTT
ncbi:hypothetical protein L1275_001237 [Flavobacterium sp. HSC-61S13]|nr:hypothetical protein [Flavobacterium sp. HSC-61S13]